MIFFDLLAVVPLIGAAIRDQKTKTISDAHIIAIFICAVAKAVGTDYSALELITGGVLVGTVFGVWGVATDAFGGGDVKMATVLGCLYGWRKAMGVMMLALLLGCLICRRERKGALAPFVLTSDLIFIIGGLIRYV